MRGINVTYIIYVVGLVQGLYLMMALLSHQRGNKIANRWLAAFVGSFTMMVLAGITFESGIYELHPWMFTSITGALYLMGPTIYFYTRSLTVFPRFKPIDFLHFVPFVLYTAYIIYINSLFSDAEIVENLKYWNRRHDSEPFVKVIPWMPIFKTVHVVTYVVVVLQMLHRFNQKLKTQLASLEKIKLQWLKVLLYTFASWMIILLLLTGVVHLGRVYMLFHNLDAIATVGCIAMIFFIGFMSIRQPEIISGEVVAKEFIKVEPQNSPLATTHKYQKTGLNTDQTQGLYEKLKRLMEAEKLYLDNEITLTKLSEEMDLTPHQLSQVINEQAQKNFYDFINAYRVAEAQKLLQNQEYAQYTILHIAYESGFSNKNSFNRAFKKMTQMTPSEFKASRK